jgi:hypothetical protein
VNITALIAWIVTAGGGVYLLATWLAHGGTRAPGSSRFPPALIFGHFALAAVGLVVWIVFVIAGGRALAWIAFALLVLIALLGFTMFARWLPGYRGRGSAVTGGPGTTTMSDLEPAERHFPVVLVGGHGVLAVATVILVLLAAAGS